MSFRAVRLGSLQVCGDTCPAAVAASGQITADTPGRFLAFMQAQGGTARSIIFLDSPGGSVPASVRFGQLLRQLGETAVVARVDADAAGAVLVNGQCFSACVYAFIGARRRIVPERSQLGIHSMVLVEEGIDASGTVLMRRRKFDDRDVRTFLMRYSARMGVSPDVIVAAERVSPNDLRILSRSELRRWHLAGSAF